MKKKIAIMFISIMLISTFSLSAFATVRHSGEPDYAPVPSSPETKVSKEKERNTVNPPDGNDNIGTDFYIYDYQDKILSFQLTADVPMKVAVAVAGDGSVLTPTGNTYGITNYSGYPISVTNMAVDTDGKVAGWTLAKDDTITAAPENGKNISVKLGNIDLADTSALSNPGITVPASDNVTSGKFQALDITAKASSGNSDVSASSGYAFTVIYTLQLNK